MKQYFVYGLLLAGVLGTQSVLAKGTDIDGDGVFSKEEITQARYKQLDKKFEKLDTNKDGQVSMDELKGQRGGIAKKADANKDGVITKAEARAYTDQSVDKYMQKKDLNRDGKLDKEERSRKTTKNTSSK